MQDYDDEAGPPTVEDDAWFTHAVASLGYPKGKRDPKPMDGQTNLFDTGIFKFDRAGTWQYVGGAWHFLGPSDG